MAAPPDKTIAELLTRHLALVRAPIPDTLPSHMATVHMLNRCTTLQVDLLPWHFDPDYPHQLADQVLGLSKQHEAPALTLQVQLALFIQQALRK